MHNDSEQQRLRGAGAMLQRISCRGAENGRVGTEGASDSAGSTCS